MPSTSLLARLRHDYPQFIFQNASVSRWSPRDNTVYYGSLRSAHDRAILLHELGHAVQDHLSFEQDIELLNLERAAWTTARQLATHYDIAIDDELVESHLDSYRQWLHDRSRCPHCHSSGLQRTDGSYACVLCFAQWTANDARQCGLRRVLKPKAPQV